MSIICNIFVVDIGDTACSGERFPPPPPKPRIQIFGPSNTQGDPENGKITEGKIIINEDVEPNPLLTETEIYAPIRSNYGGNSGVINIF